MRLPIAKQRLLSLWRGTAPQNISADIFVSLKSDGSRATSSSIEMLASKVFSKVTAFYSVGSRLGVCMQSALSPTHTRADSRLLYVAYRGSGRLASVPCPLYLQKD